MSFKVHLLIISMIIIVISLIWQNIQFNQKPVVQTPIVESKYKISIAHASWGLNCRERFRYPPKTLHDDNVKKPVVALCEGKVSCTIPINSASLGRDPEVRCSDKLLKVEYRCFSYDRLHEAKEISGSLKIDCEESQEDENQ